MQVTIRGIDELYTNVYHERCYSVAENCPETKIRYLEMIQTIIARMASNSFMLKGWAVTLIAGIFVLASADSDNCFILIAYIPTIMFWLLDSYYLQQERLYRKLYNYAVKLKPEDIDMELALFDPDKKSETKYLQCVSSKTEAGFYIPTAIAVAVVIYFALY